MQRSEPIQTLRRSPRRRVKEFLKRRIRNCFEFGQRLGVDILPRHFYSQIPNIRELRSDREWMKPLRMKGVAEDLDAQFRLVEECRAATETPIQANIVYQTAVEMNGEAGYGLPDAEFLYYFIRAKRPKRIMQVGAGVATAVMLLAAQDAGYVPEVTCIDPYPTAFLKTRHSQGEIWLIEKKVQFVEPEVFGHLEANDLFFVDSTHTVRPGSEVTRLMLEIVPSLRPHCWVHFHDIWFPYDYAPGTMTNDLFWCHESVLLHAFLAFNERVKLRASLSQLYYHDARRLRNSLEAVEKSERPHGFFEGEEGYPSAAYLEISEK